MTKTLLQDSARLAADSLWIEPMTAETLPAVYAIEKKAYTAPWPIECFKDELRRNDFAHYFTGAIDGRIVGFVGLWKALDEAHITNLAVDPQWRRKKIGERLLIHALRWGAAEGAKTFFLEARKSNAPALTLYEKYGFEFVRVRKRYYSDNGEDALVLKLERVGERAFQSRIEVRFRELSGMEGRPGAPAAQSAGEMKNMALAL